MAKKINSKISTEFNYDNKSYFNKYKSNKKFDGLSISSKCNYLNKFHYELEEFENINSANKKSELNNFVYDNTFDLHNILLANYEKQYSNFQVMRESKTHVPNNILVIDFLMILNTIIILLKNQKLLKKYWTVYHHWKMLKKDIIM